MSSGLYLSQGISKGAVQTLGGAAAQRFGSSASATRTKETPEIVLYQYKICPFCNAVKAVLDFYNVPYRCVEVNPASKEEIKEPWNTSEYKKVPIARIGGQQVNDSLAIIEELVEVLVSNGTITKAETEKFSGASAKKWADWAGKSLGVLLFPNITRNFGESWQAFGYINDVPHFGTKAKVVNRIFGPVAMWAAQGKIKKKYNIDDEREELFAALKLWTSEIGDAPFHGGISPDLADLYAFGTIRALQGMDTHADVMKDEAVRQWYENMENAVGTSAMTGWE
jgi:microsomal prostaglandin-E synthase 2|eukprot:g8031.t1